METLTNEQVVRELVEPTDGMDLKRVYGDDDEWQRLRARMGPCVTDDCRFTWVAPGTRAERIGLDEFREQWLEWMEAWESYRSETEEVRVVDDERVLVLVTQTGTLPGGVEVPLKAAGVATVRDGLVCAVEFHASREDALAQDHPRG